MNTKLNILLAFLIGAFVCSPVFSVSAEEMMKDEAVVEDAAMDEAEGVVAEEVEAAEEVAEDVAAEAVEATEEMVDEAATDAATK